MALIPFLGRRNNLWDVPDPMEVMATLFDNTPVSSFARDAHAVASTNVDWKETPKEHVFKADLPGLKKEEVKVQVEDDRTLSISGQRMKEEVQKTDTWHRVERSTGSFMRKFRLPENVQLDKITAKCENGVLTVTVPKLEKTHPKSRTIEIGGHDNESQQQQQVHVENNQTSEHHQPSEHIQVSEHSQPSEHHQASEHNQPSEHKSA